MTSPSLHTWILTFWCWLRGLPILHQLKRNPTNTYERAGLRNICCGQHGIMHFENRRVEVVFEYRHKKPGICGRICGSAGWGSSWRQTIHGTGRSKVCHVPKLWTFALVSTHKSQLPHIPPDDYWISLPYVDFYPLVKWRASVPQDTKISMAYINDMCDKLDTRSPDDRNTKSMTEFS